MLGLRDFIPLEQAQVASSISIASRAVGRRRNLSPERTERALHRSRRANLTPWPRAATSLTLLPALEESPVRRSGVSADPAEPPGERGIGWRPSSAVLWMAVGFLVAAALAAIVRVSFGAHSDGLPLRLTARWSFLLFWLAYTGSAMATLWGPRFSGVARRGREFGLAFASAQLVHVGLVLRYGAGAGMMFFWIGILFTYLLAFFSLPRLRDALGPRLWRMFLTTALNYIALVFAADFIQGPLERGGVAKYPLSYLPFSFMLVGGVALRVAAFLHRRSRHWRRPNTA
jgi:hypothetical protein